MSENERKSKIALGIFIICLIFGLETRLADARMPNPLSPLVWTVLGLVGACALAASLWFRHKGKQDGQ
jgi:multisubunit Na+/H+ antiporter MnhB subunit